MESDAKELEELTSRYSIFSVSQDEKKTFSPEMFLGYEVENIELIAFKLAKSDSKEYKRLLEDVAISELIRLFAIEAAINYSEYKNAEK